MQLILECKNNMNKGLKNIFVSQKFQIIMSTVALGITQNLARPKKL